MTYDKYKKDPLWEKIDKLIADLEENQDVEITTVRDFVIGYLVKNLRSAKKPKNSSKIEQTKNKK